MPCHCVDKVARFCISSRSLLTLALRFCKYVQQAAQYHDQGNNQPSIKAHNLRLTDKLLKFIDINWAVRLEKNKLSVR